MCDTQGLHRIDSTSVSVAIVHDLIAALILASYSDHVAIRNSIEIVAEKVDLVARAVRIKSASLDDLSFWVVMDDIMPTASFVALDTVNLNRCTTAASARARGH